MFSHPSSEEGDAVEEVWGAHEASLLWIGGGEHPEAQADDIRLLRVNHPRTNMFANRCGWIAVVSTALIPHLGCTPTGRSHEALN